MIYNNRQPFQPTSIYNEGETIQPTGVFMPTIIEREGNVERTYDISSRLLKDRNIFLYGAFDTTQAYAIIGQLLWLDKESKTEPIYIYINSPGGVIDDGLAILDAMKFIEAPVHTVVTGLAASMGAFIAAMGDERSALPNARIMIHQPLGGARGQATEIQIAAEQIEILKVKLGKYLSHQTKKSYEDIIKDMDRDNWMSAQQAKEYGLIDFVTPYTKDFPTF